MAACIVFIAFHAGAMYTGTYGFNQVYFLSGDVPQKQIGFQDSKLNFGVVCEIDKRDQTKIADDAYQYSQMTQCRLVNGRIGEKWGNESFPSYNVYQAVRCMRNTGNRSKCIPE